MSRIYIVSQLEGGGYKKGTTFIMTGAEAEHIRMQAQQGSGCVCAHTRTHLLNTEHCLLTLSLPLHFYTRQERWPGPFFFA
jgi:hypothetical protein